MMIGSTNVGSNHDKLSRFGSNLGSVRLQGIEVFILIFVVLSSSLIENEWNGKSND